MFIGIPPSRRRSASTRKPSLVASLLGSLLGSLVLATTWACQSTEPAAGPTTTSAPDAAPTEARVKAAGTTTSVATYTSAMKEPLSAELLSRELSSRMKEVDSRFYDFEDALRRPQAPETRQELAQLVTLIRSARETRAEEGFRAMADQSLEAFGELAHQLDGNDATARLKAYDRVAGRCDACHRKYRKK